MRPSVQSKKGKICYFVFILPKALEIIKNAGLSHPNEKNVRELVNKMENSSTDHRSNFVGQPKKVCCIKITRTSLPAGILQEIDKCKYEPFVCAPVYPI